MKPIGGYFGLEVPRGNLPHGRAIPVNFGRGGLGLILRARGYRKVWIPDYICPSVPAYLEKLGVESETYEMDISLEPKFIPESGDGEAFLYVNFFGVKDAFCRKLERAFSARGNLILDLTQAFHYVPRTADAFNSARKFFGVPDGGFVYGKGLSDETLPESRSYDRCEALLRRADGDLAGGYAAFHGLAETFGELPPAKMSLLTRLMLSSCDIRGACRQRRRNFLELSRSLRDTNLLNCDLSDKCAPLVYPYLIPNGAALKKRLIAERIFCPTYWPGLRDTGEAGARFCEDLVCIPCDQRYDADDMGRVLEMIAT